MVQQRPWLGIRLRPPTRLLIPVDHIQLTPSAILSGILTEAAFDGGRVCFLQAVGEAVAWAACCEAVRWPGAICGRPAGGHC